MGIDWSTVLVALLGSNLAVEIWKTISESARNKKKINVEKELAEIKDSIKTLGKVNEENFRAINERLDNHEKRFAAINKRLDNFEKELNEVKETLNQTAEGTILGLQADQIIFAALRKGHINGESELQDKKIGEYFSRCAEKSFKV